MLREPRLVTSSDGSRALSPSLTTMTLGPHLTARHLFWILLALPLMEVSGCNDSVYSHVLNVFCLDSFQMQMQVLGERLWCDWDETQRIYADFTNCTHFLSDSLDCIWPNQLMDHLFTGVHRDYFKKCSMTGRLPADPPFPILCSFIVIPILITLLMTALVMWRSKRSEGIV